MKKPFLLAFALCAPAFLFAGVDQAVVEPAGTDTYKISFRATPDTGPIAIFASSRADRIDSAQPVAAGATSPATVKVAAEQRVYFHLKPASGPTRVVSQRVLPLEGGINFRDLGGYPTKDGKHVKWGVVYRSAKLDQLTPRDYAYMENLGLKLVCDFRMEQERNRAPTSWSGPKAPEIFFNPIDTPAGPRRAQQAMTPEERAKVPSGLAGTYRWMATDALPEFGVIMKRIAAGDTPTLFHCQEGRGRTGLFAALLLLALDVPRDVIMRDFMLTNDLLLTDEALTKMTNAMGGGRGGAQSIESMRNQLRISEDYLLAAYAGIDEKFPTTEAFLRDGLKLTPAEVTALRTRLLEP
jgi:protein-tyrosine phosphatase